jgi:polygalacturonase
MHPFSPRTARLKSLGATLLLLCAHPLIADLDRPFTPTPPATATIPARNALLTDFGARPDGQTLNTEAFSKAIKSLSDTGGGTLIVTPGIWLTGPIRLQSRINLHLEAGALIQFSRDFALYPMHLFNARGEKSVETISPLYGENLEDIAITGSGVIDGGGDAWRLVKKSKVTEGFWKTLVASGGVLNAKANEWWPTMAAMEGAKATSELEKKGSLVVADYEPHRVFLRPRLLRLLDCRRVLIEGVTLRNAPNWTVHPWLCEDLTIRNVTIFNDRWAQNSDAFDIDSCRRVHVTGCVIDTGDDGVCIKSGINEVGRRIGVPTEDVLVENCIVYESHGGFTIGSEMSGGARNILVQNCTFIGTALGLRFKTARGRGGVVENIHVRDIRMTGIEGNPVDFNFMYFQKGEQPAATPPVDEGTPEFRNMLFENIVAVGSEGTMVMRGLPEMPLRNITLRNVSLSGKNGADLAHCAGFVFENVTVRHTEGDVLKTDHVVDSNIPLAR